MGGDATPAPQDAIKEIPTAETFNYREFLEGLNKRWNDKLLAAIPTAQLQETSAWIQALDNPLFSRTLRGTDVKERLSVDEKQGILFGAFSQRALVWGAIAERSEGDDKKYAELQQKIAEASAAVAKPKPDDEERTLEDVLDEMAKNQSENK